MEIERDRKKAKWIYNATWAGVVVASLAPFAWLPEWYFYIFMFSNGLGERLAQWVCRREGISQEVERWEIIERSPGAAMVPYMSAPPTFSLGRRSSPRARVSPEGIEHADWRGRMQMIPWQEIASCALNTSLDVRGHRVSHCLAICGGDGTKLTHICVWDKEAATMMPAIRFYLRGEEAPQVLGGSPWNTSTPNRP